MRGRRSSLTALLLFLGLALFGLITKGPPRPEPDPKGTFSFAVLGDAPYYPQEDLQYRLVLAALRAHDLRFVLHVGDILGSPCTEPRYRRTLREFQSLPHPVIYTPGDNEWTDCWSELSGEYEPLDRLRLLRETLFPVPGESLGGQPIQVDSQARSGRFSELVENVRWSRDGLVFATVHLVGSANGRDEFPGRTEADDAEVERRTAGATLWLRETLVAARQSGASAVVLAFHASPEFEEPFDRPYRQAYEPFLTALEEEAATFARPVLVVHGDNHEYLVDRPVTDRRTGRTLENLTRLQVPGSPDVGWVRVVVSPATDSDAETRFDFHPWIVPKWKYW